MIYQQPPCDLVPVDFEIAPGPPFLTSDRIHDGTAFNMILKDLYLRYHSLRGLKVRYVPSWDAHGLPIERAVGATASENFTEACETMIQRHRRGMVACMGALSLSFDPAHTYQYSTHHVAHYRRCWHLLRRLYEQGKVLRGSGYVHSCPVCRTNLTNSEVEYQKRDTVYAGFTFEIIRGPETGAFLKVETTTPWTLGLNQGVAYNPSMTYGVCQQGHRRCVKAMAGGTLDLSQMVYRRPDGLQGRLYAAGFVDQRGTGLVHLAPVVGQIDATVLTPDKPNLGPDLTYLWRDQLVSPSAHPFEPQYCTATTHRVGTCYRCGTVVTHRRAGAQTYLALTDPLIKQAGRQVEFGVAGWRQNFLDWLDGLKDRWCISRPRKFAIPLNLYRSQDQWFVAAVDGQGPQAVRSQGRELPPQVQKDGRMWRLDGATFDVWFQSAALVRDDAPFSLMVEGKDQIRGFFANCHVLSVLCHGRPATKKILVSPYVNQRPGVKLSKSAGALLRVQPYGPLDVVKYRLYLLNHGWTDLVFNEDNAAGASHWLTTLVHTQRFLHSLGQGRYQPAVLTVANRWLRGRYSDMERAYFRHMDLWRHDQALKQLRRFTVDVLSRCFVNGFKQLLKFAGRPGGAPALEILGCIKALLGPFVGTASALGVVVQTPVGDAWLQVPKGTIPHRTLFTQCRITNPRQQFLATHRARVQRILSGPTRWEQPVDLRVFSPEWVLVQSSEPWVNGGAIGLPSPEGRTPSVREIKIATQVGLLQRQLDLLLHDRDSPLLSQAEYCTKKLLEQKIRGALNALKTPRPVVNKQKGLVPSLDAWYHLYPHWETEEFLIVCGKNARRSAELKQKVGPQWYVLHAEGPGGSVFLRSTSGHRDHLLKAASLAVVHSAGWSRGASSKVRVTYGEMGQVRFRTSFDAKKCLLSFREPRYLEVTPSDLAALRLNVVQGRLAYDRQGFAFRPGQQPLEEVWNKLGVKYSPDYMGRVWPSFVCI